MKIFFILLFSFFIGFSHSLHGHHKTFFGVESNKIDPPKAKKLGFDQAYGVYLTKIIPGTSADQNGFQVFDYITKIGEYTLTNDFRMGHALGKYNPEDQVEFEFIRRGQKYTKSVVLGTRDDAIQMHRSDSANPFLGITQDHYNWREVIEGVQVNIVENSTAEDLGLRDEDIILEIDGTPMLDWHDIGAAIDNREVGEDIEILYQRENKEFTINGAIRSEASSGAHAMTWEEKKALIDEMDVEIVDVQEEEIQEIIPEPMNDMPIARDLIFEQVKVFPNPNAGMFTLSFELGKRGNTQINIFNSNGQLAFSRSLDNFQGSFTESLDLMDAGPGTYFIIISQNGEAVTRKIIITRN